MRPSTNTVGNLANLLLPPGTVNQIVSEALLNPDLVAQGYAIREEAKDGLTKVVIATAVLSALGATLGTWLVMRSR